MYYWRVAASQPYCYNGAIFSVYMFVVDRRVRMRVLRANVKPACYKFKGRKFACMSIATGLRRLTKPTLRTTKLNAICGSAAAACLCYNQFLSAVPSYAIYHCHRQHYPSDHTTSTTDHPSLRFTGVTSCYAWPPDGTTTTLCTTCCVLRFFGMKYVTVYITNYLYRATLTTSGIAPARQKCLALY